MARTVMFTSSVIIHAHRRRLPQGNGGDCPRRTLLIGRRPVRTLTRRTISSLFLCRKLHLFLANQQKLLLPELHFLTAICTKSFVGWGFSPHPTGRAYSAPSDTLGVFRGPTSKGWWRGTVVERRSLAGELSLSCARPAADG